MRTTAAQGWLAEALGLRLELYDDRAGLGIDALAALALRDNPRRAHLLVSRVLGKHLAVDPLVALAAGALLADEAAATLRRWSGPAEQAARPDSRSASRGAGLALTDRGAAARLLAGGPVALPVPPLVVGYAETATALGHAVADRLAGAAYLHSTRRAVDGVPDALRFEEEHSHATSHLLLPADPGLLTQRRPVMLVDDELSTGRTVRNTVRALHAATGGAATGYLVASLLDLRGAADRRAQDELADELGVPVGAVALLSGELRLPADLATRAHRVLAEHAGPVTQPQATPSRPARRHRPSWPHGVVEGARHGFCAADAAALAPVLDALAADLRPELEGGDVLVLGTEELMYLPLALAARLGPGVVYQSTTRSPVVPVDRDGYAVRFAASFAAPDEPGRLSRVHNLAPASRDAVVLVTDAPPTPGLLAVLAAAARGPVHVVEVPAVVPAARAAVPA